MGGWSKFTFKFANEIKVGIFNQRRNEEDSEEISLKYK